MHPRSRFEGPAIPTDLVAWIIPKDVLSLVFFNTRDSLLRKLVCIVASKSDNGIIRPDIFSPHVRSLQEFPIVLKYICIRVHHMDGGVRIRIISWFYHG